MDLCSRTLTDHARKYGPLGNTSNQTLMVCIGRLLERVDKINRCYDHLPMRGFEVKRITLPHCWLLSLLLDTRWFLRPNIDDFLRQPIPTISRIPLKTQSSDRKVFGFLFHKNYNDSAEEFNFCSFVKFLAHFKVAYSGSTFSFLAIILL